MKIRNSYVSNSSSCSYLVKIDLSQYGIACLKLNLQQKQKLANAGYIKQQDISNDFFLTQFLYMEKFDINSIQSYEYINGQMNEQPYDYEYFNEYQLGQWGKSVYLKKQHDNSKQMTLKQFVKYYKDSDLPQNFIVSHTDDGFEFKYIR